MENYLLNRTRKVNLAIFLAGIIGILSSIFIEVHEIITLVSFTAFLYPFIFGGLTLSITKFESTVDSTPKWFKWLIILTAAIAAVYTMGIVGGIWYAYLFDIGAEYRDQYTLPGVYFLLVSITVVTMGRLIASKTKNPLFILG